MRKYTRGWKSPDTCTNAEMTRKLYELFYYHGEHMVTGCRNVRRRQGKLAKVVEKFGKDTKKLLEKQNKDTKQELSNITDKLEAAAVAIDRLTKTTDTTHPSKDTVQDTVSEIALENKKKKMKRKWLAN